MKKLRATLFPMLLGTCFIFGSIPAVNAQESASDEFTLEEITVTAEKRVENLQKVSMSVAVIKGDDLQNQGATSIQDILKDIPNVSTSDAGGGNGYMINIRGLGNDMPSGVGESSVSMNVDGAFQARSDAGMFGYFDVEQVEVLRGPQGTLYGRNATGGVVNISSKKPSTDKIEGYVSLEAGDFKKQKQEAAINVPVTDTFAARLSLVSSKQNSYTYDSNNSRDSQEGLATRIQLRYMPSDDISLNLLYSYTERNGGLWSDVKKTNWDAGKYYLNNNTYPYDTTRKIKGINSKVSVTAEFPAGPGIVTLIPTYQKDKGRSTTYEIGRGQTEPTFTAGYKPWKDETKIFDVRYASSSDATIKWTTGVYWTQTDSPRYPTDYEENGKAWNNSKAVLGQITYPFTDTLRGIVGARYSIDKKGFDNVDWNSRDTSFGSDSDSFSFKYFDWKVGVENDFAKDIMSYLTLASGHKPGGYSDMDGKPFDVESDISGELGVKSRFMDNRLQFNGDVFYYQYKGYQIVDSYFITNPSTGLDEMYVKFYNSESKVQSMGAEFDAVALVGDATELTMNFSYLKNKYMEDFILHTDPTDPAGVNMKGKSMPHSPKYNIKGGVAHTFYFGDGSTVKPSISYRWTSEQYYGTQPLPGNLGPSYGVCDFTMAYTSTKSWAMNFYANNALNKHYYTGSVQQGDGTIIYFPSSPRAMGLTLKIAF